MLEGLTETCAWVTQFWAGILYRLRNISVSIPAAWTWAAPTLVLVFPAAVCASKEIPMKLSFKLT
jgi:hypothetical protein